MLGKCLICACPTIEERSIQTASTPFNIFERELKGNVESMLNESLNRFKCDSTPSFNKLSTFFTLSAMLNDLFKRTGHLVQQSVECMFKRTLKPFKRAFILRGTNLELFRLEVHFLWRRKCMKMDFQRIDRHTMRRRT